MFELVEVKTGRIIERYDYDFDEFIKTKYSGFFSLITDDVFTAGDVMPEFAWRRSNKMWMAEQVYAQIKEKESGINVK